MRHFALERGGQYWEIAGICDQDGKIAFEDLINMSYDEMKCYDQIEDFIVAVMDATNQMADNIDDNTCITLVGDDDVFIWGIIIGRGEVEDELHYVFVDWKKDGKSYRYEK